MADMTDNENSAPFVGREDELKRATEYIRRSANADDPRKALSFVGAPKIGKSRLLYEIESSVRSDSEDKSRPRCVILGRCKLGETGITQDDLIVALRRVKVDESLRKNRDELTIKYMDLRGRTARAKLFQEIATLGATPTHQIPPEMSTGGNREGRSLELVTVILLDDFDKALLKADEGVSKERYLTPEDLWLLAGQCSNVRLIVTSTNSLSKAAIPQYNQYFDSPIDLEQLSKEKAAILVRKLLTLSDNTSTDLEESILRHTGYHPYYIDELCGIIGQRGKNESDKPLERIKWGMQAVEQWQSKVRPHMEEMWEKWIWPTDPRYQFEDSTELRKLAGEKPIRYEVPVPPPVVLLTHRGIVAKEGIGAAATYHIPSEDMRCLVNKNLDDWERPSSASIQQIPFNKTGFAWWIYLLIVGILVIGALRLLVWDTTPPLALWVFGLLVSTPVLVLVIWGIRNLCPRMKAYWKEKRLTWSIR
ncbi:MAG: ATP-binding protein [Chloroflexi bacterium]|nr:ATP-binding protein [Chloroflexota bacterium]